jgi:hypothetical protein
MHAFTIDFEKINNILLTMKQLNYIVETDTETVEFPISHEGLEKAITLASKNQTNVDVKQEKNGIISFVEIWNFNDYVIKGFE